MILVLKITPLKTYNFIKDFIEKIKISSKKSIDEYSDDTNEETVENKFVFKNEEEIQQVKPTIENFSKIDSEEENNLEKKADDKIEMKVEEVSDEERIKSESENILKKHGEYDHTLELKVLSSHR